MNMPHHRPTWINSTHQKKKTMDRTNCVSYFMNFGPGNFDPSQNEKTIMLLMILGCLLFVHFVAWLTRRCSHCCTEMCIILGFFAFLGFIFSCATLLIFTQSSQLAIDPVLRVWITGYLLIQTAGCFITFIFSVVGHRVCKWFFNKMEILVPRIQALIICFIQRNWKQRALSLLFVNVEIFMIVGK